MKTKSKLFVSLAMCVAVTLGVGLVSCNDDEPTPEIVENPLDAETYYITGKMLQVSAPLEGVTVTVSGSEVKSAADGTFLLEVKTTGDYVVSFVKEGYLPLSTEVEIPSDAKTRSSVTLTQEMTKANRPVSVKSDEDAVIIEDSKKLTALHILAGSVEAVTDITITEYLPGAKKSTDQVSLSTVNCQPDGMIFTKPVVVKVQNLASNRIYFGDVKHFVEHNGGWKETGNLMYDAAENVYKTELNNFSNHSFGPRYQVVNDGTSSENLGEVSTDNLGKMGAVEVAVTGKQKSGWTMDGDLNALLQAQFPALNEEDISGLSTTIHHAIASTRGSRAGISESSVSMGVAKVSGDMKMTVSFAARLSKSKVVFNLMYLGQPVSIGIPILTYTGVATEIIYQYGSSHTDHSGGSIGG